MVDRPHTDRLHADRGSKGAAVSTTIDTQALKQAHRRTWASGDYPRIAELVTAVGERVVERAGVTPGADAEDLPFADARFDRGLSSLGVQFAPRHDIAARELVRVCRPGGDDRPRKLGRRRLHRTVLDGHGRLPPSAARLRVPTAGVGSHRLCQAPICRAPGRLTFERDTMHFETDSPEAFIDLMADCYGPLLQAHQALAADGRWADLREELIALSAHANLAEDGRFRAASDYCVIIAQKAS
jgi:SAM-dependent methyltransferase